MVQPKGLWYREEGTLPWVVQVTGNGGMLVGITTRIVKLQKY